MKVKELLEKEVVDLLKIKVELEKRLYVILVQTKIGQNKYVHKIPALKKDIARIYTALSQKGVNKKKINAIENTFKDEDLKNTFSEEAKMDAKRTEAKEAKKAEAEKKAAPADSDKKTKDTKEAPVKKATKAKTAAAKPKAKSTKKEDNK